MTLVSGRARRIDPYIYSIYGAMGDGRVRVGRGAGGIERTGRGTGEPEPSGAVVSRQVETRVIAATTDRTSACEIIRNRIGNRDG